MSADTSGGLPKPDFVKAGKAAVTGRHYNCRGKKHCFGQYRQGTGSPPPALQSPSSTLYQQNLTETPTGMNMV